MDNENEKSKELTTTSSDKFCVNCGAKVEQNQLYCSVCGNKLNTVSKKIKLSIPKKIKLNKKVLIILGIVVGILAIVIGLKLSSNNKKDKIENAYIEEAQTQYQKYDSYDEKMTKYELREICDEYLEDSTDLLGEYEVVDAGAKYNNGEIIVYQIDEEDMKHMKKDSDYGEELIKLAIQRYICNRDTIWEDEWFYLALDYDCKDEEENGYQFFISYENEGVIEVADFVNEILVDIDVE